MNNDDYIPMRSVYLRNGITADCVAKVRKDALEAETERTVKLSGVVLDDSSLPPNLTKAIESSMELVLIHRTVDHRTRLAAAEAVVQEMGLKPSAKLDVNMQASGILAELLKDIDGATLGIPSKRKESDE
jgi:hypothetical protein